MVVVLMGVAGSGKTTIGSMLASALRCPFYDGDDYHPPENIAKMRGGEPLDDQDRVRWLIRIRTLIDGLLASGRDGVVACSALKVRYRDLLGVGRPLVRLVYLKGEFPLLFERLRVRSSHFMRETMLKSQFEALEEPGDAIVLDVTMEPAAAVEDIRRALGGTA
jgi:gluconokinase